MELGDPMRKPRSTAFHPPSRRSARLRERGIALVFTLLMLMMIVALTLGMVIAFSSQTLIGGYYRNFRGSYYAADSGMNIAREQLVNNLRVSVPGTFAEPPISNVGAVCGTASTGVPETDAAGVLSAYGSSTSLNAGSGSTSWKESFHITNSSLCLASTPTVTAVNTSAQGCSSATVSSVSLTSACDAGYQYVFNYSLTSVGAASGSEADTVTENGSIRMNITGQAASNAVSFAYFGAFIDKYPPCDGPLVPGTMTGPMFTNQGWEFMAAIPPYTAPYIFTDPVGQAGSSMNWWNSSWGCNTSTTTGPWGSGSSLVNPNFQAGYQMNQPTVALPANTISQEWAVIDGEGCGALEGDACGGSNTNVNPVTTGDLNQFLQNINGVAYPSTGASTGVYLTDPGKTAAVCGAKSVPCVQGGGFYIQGNASVELQPSGSTAEVYKITQGSTVTTITVDPAANGGIGTTVIASGTATETLSGVPMDNFTGLPSTMLYDNGSITSLSGPGQGQAAIQDNAMITITAQDNITATGDVLYKTEPVTDTQNEVVAGTNPPCCSGDPVDTLIPSAENMNQVLGIFTATGNFTVQSTYANSNIQVDGSIATISATASGGCNQGSGTGGFLANGFVNTFNNVGGQIQSCIYSADIDTENVWFDRRFTARPGFAPPWFPSTTLSVGGALPTNTTTSIQRTQWLNTTVL
jgi:Tfp pilus assembly protein PilX